MGTVAEMEDGSSIVFEFYIVGKEGLKYLIEFNNDLFVIDIFDDSIRMEYRDYDALLDEEYWEDAPSYVTDDQLFNIRRIFHRMFC